VRVPIDISARKKVKLQIHCPACKRLTSQVETRTRSLIWYCSSCDVYHEVTPQGLILRSFKKQADIIVNLPDQEV